MNVSFTQCALEVVRQMSVMQTGPLWKGWSSFYKSGPVLVQSKGWWSDLRSDLQSRNTQVIVLFHTTSVNSLINSKVL